MSDIEKITPSQTQLSPSIKAGSSARSAVSPTGTKRRDLYRVIRQGTATNTLTKMRAIPGKNIVFDKYKGIGTVTRGNFSLSFPADLVGLKTTAYQLLDALVMTLTETGAKSPQVLLPLDEYMALRGLKNKKEARKQADADLEALFTARISFKEKRKRGQEMDYDDIRIIGHKGIKNGIIRVTLESNFYDILLGYPVMYYPAQLWTINSKKNPNSFNLLRKITEHKNMNAGKKNEDIISVKTLLDATPHLSTYEDVMANGRQLSQRIIDPFERDMNALEPTLSWAYCHRNNEPLSEEELSSMTYEVFSSLLVKVDWKKYPDQTARLERKAERKQLAEQTKKKPATKE